MTAIFRRAAMLPRAERPAEESISELFHENTKLHRATAGAAVSDESYGVRELESMARAYKRYRLRPQVPLSRLQLAETPGKALESPLAEVILARRSGRAFGPGRLTLAEVSSVLQMSYGVTGATGIPGGGVQSFRAAPSAGALYPAEIYVGARAVQGLDAGIYHYEVPVASLALLDAGDPTERLHAVCCGQDHTRQAGIVVLISAMIERTKRKYGDRGYRYVLIEIGHVGQNLYLACTALGLSIITTCGFFDDEAAALLGIDGCDEAVFYVAFIGRAPAVES